MLKISTHFSRTALSLVCAGALLLAGCTQDMKNDIAELQKRVYDLEEQMDALQAQIDAGGMIESVTPLSGTPGGIRILFTDNTSVDIKNGTNGAAGADAVTPRVRVIPNNSDGSRTIQYNVTATYPESGWVNAGESFARPPEFQVDENGALEYNVGAGWVPLDIESSDPYGLVAYIDNGNGTVTFLMGGEQFTFRKYSTAESFVVLETRVITLAEGESASVRFRVNPSSAEIPLTKDRWMLDLTGTRASYLTEQNNFSLASITPDGDKEGQYIASIRCEELDPAKTEYDLTLVLDNSAEGEEGTDLISSTPFTFGYVVLTGFELQEEGDRAMVVGETYAVKTPVYTPENATNKDFTLVSSDETVVSVGGDGITLTALKAGGPVTITATSAEGEEFSDSFRITVADVPVERIELDQTVLYVPMGGTARITATVLPENATDKKVVWESDGQVIASVVPEDATGWTAVITPQGIGTTIITAVADDDHSVLATCAVNVVATAAEVIPEWIEIAGTQWATHNVGATNYQGIGLQFQFGSTVGWAIETTTGDWTSLTSVDESWDMENSNPCPAGYVVPSQEQFQALIEDTDSVYAEENGVSGVRFTDQTDPEASIFFPATGQRVSASDVTDTENGHYWTNEGLPDNDPPSAFELEFDNEIFDGLHSVPVMNIANSVRCVRAE